ncbi:acyl-coenzyme A thioesterase 1-like isoform X2 [Penaeus chinensis]|uniref:acyl-coenzyme A thioesterase 1-like isoform X2 n=1 Tax=Penaeus chinensis TaxID=139456 RepID=UPI001FB5AA35|nr:acyl-coenzyme A thioesterase 1-like isoform X2 [Penaeus chinensis]
MLQASKVLQFSPKYLLPRNIRTMASAASRDVQVSVTPSSCLHDEPVQIRAEGLSPNQDVTLYLSMRDTRNVHYISTAHYRADSNGQVDVDTMESLGGSYTGHFPMGLIGTLHPAPSEYKFTRFFKRDVLNPNIVDLSVFDGHLTEEKVCTPECEKALASTKHERHYMGPGVQRIPVRYGKVRGSLFLPAGEGPFPGVVDMFGTAGGLLEYRSAQLASRGIAALSLAFFAYDDLPKTLEEFNISYFEEAVEFLLKHEKIMKPHVGAVGVSKGGDLVLSLATYIPEVKAGVWINGCNANVQSALNLRDSVLPGLEFDFGKIEIVNGAMDCFEIVHDPRDYPETIIPIEKADANFLFLVGNSDRNWKSVMYCDQAIERLKKAGRNNYEVHSYELTGHLIEPPYSPFCLSSYHKIISGPILWGGVPKPHIRAQEEAWKTMLAFLFKNLTNTKGKL